MSLETGEDKLSNVLNTEIKFDSIKFSYHGHSKNLEHPADRRRFALWARSRGCSLIDAEVEHADICVTTTAAKFDSLRRSARGPIVLDLVDGYFTYKPGIFEDVSRNLVRTLKGAGSLRRLRYSDSLISSIIRADAIVVSSAEHLNFVLPYNRNVFVIEDNFTELVSAKSEYKAPNSRFSAFSNRRGYSIIWEGLGVNLKHLCSFAEEIGAFLISSDSTLKVITTPNFYRVSNRYIKANSWEIIKSSFGEASKHIELIPWTVSNLLEATSECDVAVIPIDLSDKLGFSKPANKLISFWTLGIPTLFSPISSYIREASEAGLTDCLVSTGYWGEKLDAILKSPKLIEETLDLQNSYVVKRYNPVDNLKKWDNLFRSLIP